MTKKGIRVLVVAYVILAAAASSPFWYGRLADSLWRRQVEPVAFADYAQDADRFSISNNGQALAFEKKDGAWQVNGKPASQEIVGTFFDALRLTDVERIVSRNKDNHAAYRVHTGDTCALHVEKGGNSLDLLIGNVVPGQDAYYLRDASNDTVYEATGVLRQLATRPESNWIPEPEQPDETTEQSSA